MSVEEDLLRVLMEGKEGREKEEELKAESGYGEAEEMFRQLKDKYPQGAQALFGDLVEQFQKINNAFANATNYLKWAPESLQFAGLKLTAAFAKSCTIQVERQQKKLEETLAKNNAPAATKKVESDG